VGGDEHGERQEQRYEERQGPPGPVAVANRPAEQDHAGDPDEAVLEPVVAGDQHLPGVRRVSLLT
jgi:hypothetical protein